ncbi:MAG: exonuclease domain-containing protein [Pseudomonadota bacterium]
MNNIEHYLIVDLEATCCNQESIPRREMETIEIGAVMVRADTLNTVDEFCTFIKPVRHPILTNFCTELTSIEQTDVDAALKFPAAVDAFKRWMYQYPNFLFCSWGDYDKHQLRQDCGYHRLPFPIGAPHVNIKVRFSERQNLRKKLGMTEALRHCSIPLEGKHHRGIDDARNMARLLPFIF